MTITLKKLSFTGGEWDEQLHSRTDLQTYSSAAKTIKNFIVHPHGGVSNRGGTRYIGEIYDSTHTARLIAFQFSVTQAYILEFGYSKLQVYKDGGLIAANITMPYTAGQAQDIKFTQSADTLYITHPDFPVYKLTRSSHTAWTFTAITFGSSVSAPTNLQSAEVEDYDAPSYVVATIDSSGRSSEISNSIHCNNGILLTWTHAAGYASYDVYKDDRASDIYAWVGRSNTNQFDVPVAGIEADYSKTPQEDTTVFGAVGDYPGVVAFYEQRLVTGRTNNEPQTIFGSYLGDFESMNVSPITRVDDAYEFTMNSLELNEIKALVPLASMIIFTSGAEWVMKAGSGSAAVSPLSVDIKRQSSYGSSDVPPVVIGTSVLFLERSGTVIRDLTYDFEIEGYQGNSLATFANHLLEGYEITSMAYQRSPDSIVWMVRNDGKLLGLTYFKEFKIFAWHQHETDGDFESVATIPLADGRDELYAVVKRTIGGATKRYVERFMPRLPYDDDFVKDIEDAYFVDCGLSYDGVPADNFSGLSHLEGETVVALADGNVIRDLVVSSGAVTLPHEFSKVHIGLPYVSDLETLDFIADGQDGTNQDTMKDVKSVTVSLSNTRDLRIGPSDDESRMVDVPMRSTEAYSDPIAMFTGDKIVHLQPGSVRESKVFIRNSDPLPITVRSILPRVENGQN